MSLDNNKKLELFRTMLLIRLFEEALEEMFSRGILHGTMHLSIGQEATATGACLALTKEDLITSTHRGHGHCLAKGADTFRMFAELLGREDGYCRGRGGSMHIADLSNGNLGANGVVAGSLTIAVGAGHSLKMQKKDNVILCFFGDGAVNEGSFHEALNLAQIWKLPIVFVCENNLYMEYTPIGDVTAVEHPAADRAPAYNMDKIIVDGNDADEMYRVAKQTVEKARAGKGPSLIEAKTYRHSGHSRADPAKYRPKEEAEDWIKNKDPVNIYRQRLIDFGINDKIISSIENKIKENIEQATEACKKSPIPSLDLIHKDLWANGGSEWHN